VADRKITDLTALTTPASADVLPIVDVSEAAAADKNKKITVGELFKGVPDGTAAAPAIAFESDDGNGIFLSTTDTVGIATNGSSRMTVSTTAVTSTLPVIVPDGTAAAPSVAFTGSGTDTGIYSPGVDQVAVATNGAQRITVDASGRLLVGTSTARSNFYNGSTDPRVQVEGTDSPTSAVAAIRCSDNAGAPRFMLGKARGGSVGSTTIVSSGDVVGEISFQGSDGTEFVQLAHIQAVVDGTPGANDMPGRLVFSTTADDAASPTERLRITSAGLVGIGSSSPSEALTVSGKVQATTEFKSETGNDLRLNAGSANRDIFMQVNGSTLMTVQGSTGNVGIGTTAPGALLDVTGSNGKMLIANGTTSNSMRFSVQNATGTGNAAMVFESYNLEYGRFDASGRFLVGTSTARTVDGFAAAIQVEGASAATGAIGAYRTSNDQYGAYLTFGKSRSTSLGGSAVVSSGDEIGVLTFCNNVNLSDEREKKNIETLDSTWSCLKHWDLKKFHYNDDADTDDKRYGVIAQQVAPHCPEVITDWVKQQAKDAVLDDDGNVVTPAQEEIVRMGVKEQQMMWMAIKALQEAQTRIETLETEVAALKGA
jgi:hypothetical protein